MQIIITHNDTEIIIPMREPTFEEMSAAFMALTRVKGSTDIAGAGRVLLKACADYSKTPDAVWKNPKLEFSAALKASELIEIYEGELKKN
jgi:hypothetical protein